MKIYVLTTCGGSFARHGHFATLDDALVAAKELDHPVYTYHNQGKIWKVLPFVIEEWELGSSDKTCQYRYEIKK